MGLKINNENGRIQEQNWLMLIPFCALLFALMTIDLYFIRGPIIRPMSAWANPALAALVPMLGNAIFAATGERAAAYCCAIWATRWRSDRFAVYSQRIGLRRDFHRVLLL